MSAAAEVIDDVLEITDDTTTMLVTVEQVPSGLQMISLLEKANCQLEQARSVQEFNQVITLGKCAEAYARQQKLGREAKQQAHEIVIVASRRLGEFLAGTGRAAGGRPAKTGTSLVPVSTLAELGIDKKISSYAQRLFNLPLDLFDRVRKGWTLERAEAELRRAAKLEEFKNQIRTRRFDPDAADLRVCSCSELFASGITPAVVITEPPSARDQLHLFSDLALACVNVPFVAVMVRTARLKDALDRLSAHLQFRDALLHQGRLVLVFGDKDKRVNQYGRRSDDLHEYLLQLLTGHGDLICDPFLNVKTAVAALTQGRRFIGCDVDADRVAAARREVALEASPWAE